MICSYYDIRYLTKPTVTRSPQTGLSFCWWLLLHVTRLMGCLFCLFVYFLVLSQYHALMNKYIHIKLIQAFISPQKNGRSATAIGDVPLANGAMSFNRVCREWRCKYVSLIVCVPGSTKHDAADSLPSCFIYPTNGSDDCHAIILIVCAGTKVTRRHLKVSRRSQRSLMKCYPKSRKQARMLPSIVWSVVR